MAEERTPHTDSLMGPIPCPPDAAEPTRAAAAREVSRRKRMGTRDASAKNRRANPSETVKADHLRPLI